MLPTPPKPDVTEVAAAPASGATAASTAPRIAPNLADRPRHAVVGRQYGVFWPALLAILAFLAWTGFQTVQLVFELRALTVNQEQQEPLMQNSAKLRQSLDAIAAQTQRLAEQGNPNAKVLVDELRKRGVTINPNASAAAAPAK